LKTRRLAVAGVALFAAVGFLAAGCAKNGTSAAGSSPSPAASPSPTVAPKDALLASTKALTTTSYKFSIKTPNATGSGAADPTKKSLSMSVNVTEAQVPVKMDIVVIGTDGYFKLNLGPLGSTLGIPADKYMHLDITKLGTSSSLPLQLNGDPGDVSGQLAGLNSVSTTDGRTYTGTLDLTKVTGGSAPNQDLLNKAGDKAKAVPFTALVDGQGRLTSLKIDGTGIDPGFTIETAFSDFGSSAAISKPDASQVVEAPDAIQQLLKK
jgi:hypothetical protein